MEFREVCEFIKVKRRSTARLGTNDPEWVEWLALSILMVDKSEGFGVSREDAGKMLDLLDLYDEDLDGLHDHVMKVRQSR